MHQSIPAASGGQPGGRRGGGGVGYSWNLSTDALFLDQFIVFLLKQKAPEVLASRCKW